jgi:adenylate cyclase
VNKVFPIANWLKARFFYLLAPLVILAAIGVVASKTSFLEQLEGLTVNLRFTLRAPFDPPADSRLVLVGIDQKSIDQAGAWPWPRNVEADFLKTIVNAGANPRTVAFDILFVDAYDKFGNLQKSKSGLDYDAVLGDAAGQLPSVITGALSLSPEKDPAAEAAAEASTRAELAEPGLTPALSRVEGEVDGSVGSNVAILPVLPLRKQSLFGFVNDEPSPIDHVRRVLPLVVHVRDRVYPSLALQLLCQMLSVDPGQVEVDFVRGLVRLKNSSGKSWKIPINARGEFAINYRRQDSFQGVSFISLFGALAEHAAHGTRLPPPAQIENKVLLIGQTATGLTDLGPTPLQSDSPLVYVYLNVVNDVLKNDYLRTAPNYAIVIGWLALAWISLFRLKDAPWSEAIALPIVATGTYILAAFVVFALWSLQVPLAWPVLGYAVVTFGGVVMRWREEQQSREQLKQLFSRMLSPGVMNHLLDHPENVKLGGSERDVTILFSDIRDYTGFSEGLGPAEIVRQLNYYFERMVGCVKENEGTLHKYIGDAVMAVWGDLAVASHGPQQDACNAVRAALMMRRELRLLNEERQSANLAPLRIGIGLNHDRVLVGLIGASSRAEFTVMGDGVNIASRLEGMTKEFRTDLAISESVRRLIGEAFLVRRLGLVQLKGKTRPIMIYEVLAEKAATGAEQLAETSAGYEEALDHFFARRFADAEAGFLACGKGHPDDYPSHRYAEVAHRFAHHPPPEDWDGRIVMETK